MGRIQPELQFHESVVDIAVISNVPRFHELRLVTTEYKRDEPPKIEDAIGFLIVQDI